MSMKPDRRSRLGDIAGRAKVEGGLTGTVGQETPAAVGTKRHAARKVINALVNHSLTALNKEG